MSGLAKDENSETWREHLDTEHDAAHVTDEYQPGSDAEKKLLRKLDMRIIPCVWRKSTPTSSSTPGLQEDSNVTTIVLYLLGYLDRANIG
jgi:hypothetical protein